MTLLYLACAFQAWDLALLLLSKGADPNKAAGRSYGSVYTPLYWAARYGSTEVCRSLLASGARQDIGGEYFVDYTGCPRKKCVQLIVYMVFFVYMVFNKLCLCFVTIFIFGGTKFQNEYRSPIYEV